MTRTICVFFLLSFLVACGGSEPEQTATDARPDPASSSQPGSGATAFVNANIWDGTGTATQVGAYLLVRAGRIETVGKGDAPAGAEIIDLDGAWVGPGFINAHGHVSGLWADDSIQGDVERARGTLAVYARYGVTTVNSLGDSADPVVADGVREQRDDPALNYARAYVAGTVVAGSTAEEARSTAQANIGLGVDSMKLRVDDNLGSGQKMPWDAVQAGIGVARQNNIPVATHIFYMDDAAMLLDMGTNLIAHSVRDQRVDDAFTQKLRNSGVCYVPTLVREVTTFVYSERPDFFDDPFFLEHANRNEMARVSEPAYMARIAGSPAAAAYREALPLAQENLRTLASAGVPIAFGTDSGPGGRFPGFLEHEEFDLMAEAGLTPEEILLSATSVAADCLGLENVGTLAVGKWADFVVLAEDPLEDIKATRNLRAVYIAGNLVPDS